MFKFTDRIIEKILKKKLHKRRKRILVKTINKFVNKHHPDEATLKELKTALEKEIDRVYDFIDKSILRERLKRGRYAFWITAIASVIVIGLIGAFSAGTLLPFFIPVIAALIAWAVNLITIPISYNERLYGAMDTVVRAFEKSLLLPRNQDNNVTKEEINSIHLMLKEMKEKIEAMNQKNNDFSTEQLKDDANKLEEILKEAQTMFTINLEKKKQESWSNHFNFWEYSSNSPLPSGPPLPPVSPTARPS